MMWNYVKERQLNPEAPGVTVQQGALEQHNTVHAFVKLLSRVKAV